MAGFLEDVFKGTTKPVAKRAKKAAPKAKAPAKKPRATTAPSPSRGLGGNAVASVLGAVSGTARAAQQGKGPAATKRTVERDTAKLKRTDLIRTYLDAPRAERSKQAAAAEKRVASGKATSRDKLIVETHQRRTKNDSGRSGAAVKAANAKHDREVKQRQVTSLISSIGTTAKGTAGTEGGGIVKKLTDDFKSLPSDLVSGTRKNTGSVAKGAGALAVGTSNALVAASKLRAPGASDGLKGTKAGIDTSGAAKAIQNPVKTAGLILQVSGDDASQIPRAAKDTASSILNLPAATEQLVRHPAKTIKAIADDTSRRYKGTDDERRARMKKEGFAPEVSDLATIASAGGASAAKIVEGGSKAVAKTTKAGGRANRAATRVNRFVAEPRPDLVRSTNVAKKQKKASGIVGIAVQRGIDRSRQNRVQREASEAAARRGRLPEATTRRQARKGRALAKRTSGKLSDRNAKGAGVRGVLPKEGQVAPRFPRGQDRKVRVQTAEVASIGFRRNERLKNELTTPAKRAFQALSKPEQRAAVHALEGTISTTDPAVSLKAIDRRIKAIKAERSRMRSEQPKKWEDEYAPLLDFEPSDELVQLSKLRDTIVRNPDKVLSKRLRAFVAGEQERRPRVERVAGDSLRPSTMEARRFGPLGEQVGTRDAYVPRRAAVDRLEKATPAAALKAIGSEIRTARSAGRPPRVVRRLQAEARAVQEISKGRPMGRQLSAADLDFARTAEAATFVGRTKAVASRQGLTTDPVFVKHTKRETTGGGGFTTGGGEHGAMAGPKKSEMSLLKRGFRDTSDTAYTSGIQESVKRSVQWRMVNELVQDHVPAWSKGKDGKGLTLDEARDATTRQFLDPKDWVAWRAKRQEAHPDDDLPEGSEEIPDGDLVPLQDVTNVNWETTDRVFLIPMAAFNEMRRSHGPADTLLRKYGRVTGLQSQAILASNPAYGVRQVAQTAPLTAIAIGPTAFNAAFRRNLGAYRKAAKLTPDAYNDVLDVLGVRSKSADAVRSVRRSDSSDVRRFEGTLTHTWGGLHGGQAKDYFVAERRSPTGAGTASQAARSVVKTAFTPFRLTRDGNMMLDAKQDRMSRVAMTAAVDARMSKGDASRFGEKIAAAMNAQEKRVGPLAAVLSLPAKELDAISRSPEFRRMVSEVADGVTKWLGDYSNYTQQEQKIGRAIVPFYGFARHSTRLLFYTLPIQHPLSLAMVLSVSGADLRTKMRQFESWYERTQGAKLSTLDPALVAGYKLMLDKGDKLELVDERWLNPLTGPLFDAISSDPVTASAGVATPIAKSIIEVMSENNLFTKSALSNKNGPVGPDNPLTGFDKIRVGLNRVMGSMFPFRAWDQLANGEKGRLTDTSLPFDGQAYPYKDGGDAAARNDEKIKRAKAEGTEGRILDSVVPFRKKPSAGIVGSAQFRDEAKKKKKDAPKKPKGSSGSFGGGSFGGSGGFGGGGGF